jgi:hypothetical protein
MAWKKAPICNSKYVFGLSTIVAVVFLLFSDHVNVFLFRTRARVYLFPILVLTMSKFLRELLLFSAPFSVLLLPLIGLIYAGEIFTDYRGLANKDDKYILGLAYSEVGRQFKFVNVYDRKKFEILALGSSRVMQFRKEMFIESFYNAGGAVQSLSEYESFLRMLPQEKLPAILILGVDQWMFNAEYQREYKQDKNNKFAWTDFSSLNENVDRKIASIVRDYTSGKIDDVFKESDYDLYGLNAIVEMNGFRNDGSYYYNTAVKALRNDDSTYRDYKFKDTLQRIRGGCCRFNYGDSVDGSAIVVVDKLLEFCKKNGIHVIAFLPPFAETISKEIMESNRFRYMLEIYERMQPIFTKYEFELYDFGNLNNKIYFNDSEMIDGFHGGERSYARILLSMLESETRLRSYCNIQTLRADMNRSLDNYIIYNY